MRAEQNMAPGFLGQDIPVGDPELQVSPIAELVAPRRRRSDLEHDLFATIVEEAFSEILVFDAATLNIMLANRSARNNLGYSLNELVGMSIADLKDEFSITQLRDAYRPMLEGDTVKTVMRTVHRRKDGTFYPVEVHSQLSEFSDRQVIFQIVIDQTEIKHAQVQAGLASVIERDAAESRDKRAFLAVLLARLSWQFRCQVAHVYVWNRKAGLLETCGVWHDEDTCPDSHDIFRRVTETVTLAPSMGLPGRACEQRQLVMMEDLSRDLGFVWRGVFENSPVTTGFAMPILIDGEVAVVLEFFSIRKPTVEIWPDLVQMLGEQISRLYERKCAEESANESRERFDAAVDGAAVGLWDYNYKSGQFYLSPRCREILHLTDADPTPSWKSFGEGIHPKDIRRTAAAMNAHMLKRTPYDVEYRYRLADGRIIWLHSRAQGVWDEDGYIVRTAGTIEDVSAEKEGENVQREVLACIAASSDTATKITQALDLVSPYLKLSTAIVSRVTDDNYEVLYRSSTGAGPGLGASLPLADTLCSDVFSSDTLQAFSDLDKSPVARHPARRHVAIGAYVGITVFVKGVRFGTLSFLAPQRRKPFDEAELSMVRLLARWIGEELGRASDVAELLEKDMSISSKLAFAADALLTVDHMGRIEDANPAASRMFAWTHEELRRMSIGDLLPTAKAFSHSDGHLIPVVLRQDVAVCRDGRRIAVLLNVAEIHLGQRTIYTVAISDLTQVKQAESAKSEFVSIVSHELRTPLTSIRGALTLITNQTTGALTEETAKLANIAQRNCERLLRLVNDILAVERLESGKFEMSLESVDLNTLLSDAIAANALYAAKYDTSFQLSLCEDLPPVIADPERLLQVMANLLSNAAKFTRPGMPILVKAEPAGRAIRISVQDHGQGIPPAIRARVFEKFTQGQNPNTRASEGSGLGLSIARQMIALMNGEISFSTEDGVGTTFSVTLPISEFGAGPALAGPRALSAG